MLWSAAGAVALGGLYAWRFEDDWIRISRHDMPLPNLGSEFDGARLAHISDIHLSPVVLSRHLRHYVHIINSLDVDFVAITGDFITGPRFYAARAARVLADLDPKVATVACLGNHDYGVYHPAGLGASRTLSWHVADYLTKADAFVMLNESRTFRRGEAAIQFVGVEDFWTPHYDPKTAFEMTDPDLPTIALCHNPDAAPALAGCGANWVLAGHTHGNHVKESILSDLVFPVNHKQFAAGLYRLHDGASLYVNRGIGYGRRVNLKRRPEITLFTLRRA
jgi:hypothetical protein